MALLALNFFAALISHLDRSQVQLLQLGYCRQERSYHEQGRLRLTTKKDCR
jgi:hypothetical protein